MKDFVSCGQNTKESEDQNINEVASCLYEYLQLQKEQKRNKPFSDKCPGKNRNRLVAFAIHHVYRALSYIEKHLRFIVKDMSLDP